MPLQALTAFIWTQLTRKQAQNLQIQEEEEMGLIWEGFNKNMALTWVKWYGPQFHIDGLKDWVQCLQKWIDWVDVQQ